MMLKDSDNVVEPEKSRVLQVTEVIFSRTVCATILCIAGLVGMGYGIDGAGWVVFIGALILI